jgi:osmotically-inducible protein OsmY
MKGGKMSKRNFLRTALVLSVVTLLCGAAAMTDVGAAKTTAGTPPPVPAQRGCRSTTDAEIVSAIHEKIKADRRFDDQWRHINVSSRNRVVSLHGWVEGRAQVRALTRYASATRCVRSVNNKRLRHFLSTAGCLPGQKRCGDLCIPQDADCNIIN